MDVVVIDWDKGMVIGSHVGKMFFIWFKKMVCRNNAPLAWQCTFIYLALKEAIIPRALKVENFNRFSRVQEGKNDQYISLICRPSAVI